MSYTNPKDSFTIDGIGSFSPVNGNSGQAGFSFNFPNSTGASSGSSAAAAPAGPAAPASAPAPAAKKVQVVRRLNDDVQLSRELGADEGSADSLCSNFMAAWG